MSRVPITCAHNEAKGARNGIGLVKLMGRESGFVAAYATLASVLVQRQKSELASLWLLLGANFAYALAVTMYFREATLTLALSAQLLSLSWLMKRYRQPWLGWPLKALLAVVVIRLTFNPWPHISWSGMFVYLLLGVGWAKPVKMDASRFRMRS